MNSPYLNLPLRSEEEVRCAREQERIAKVLAIICKPTPAQEWLGSERVTKALERFRKEDGEQK